MLAREERNKASKKHGFLICSYPQLITALTSTYVEFPRKNCQYRKFYVHYSSFFSAASSNAS